MKCLIRSLLTLALCTGWLHAAAETSSEQDYRSGILTYINIAALEVGIDDRLYRLDGAFRIHGYGEGDRVQMLKYLHPGMYVRYRTTESKTGQTGQIEDILIPTN